MKINSLQGFYPTKCPPRPVFVDKLYKKTKPDSLTNQGLPGLNTANVCCFLITNKFLPVFLFHQHIYLLTCVVDVS